MNPLAIPGLGVTLQAPWALGAGAGVAGALVLLHAITVGRPRPAWLPTARFAPERAPRAVRTLSRVRDRLLLVVRVLAALLAALALAQPVSTPERAAVARLILVDRGRTAPATLAERVGPLVRVGDVVLPFDSAPGAALTRAADVDSTAWRRALQAALGASPGGARDVRAELSPALVAARRAAPALAVGADSLELVLVSPLAHETVDAATLAIRAAWGGRARVVRVPMARPDSLGRITPAGARRIALRDGPRDDALAAALALAGVTRGDDAPVRLLRGAVGDADRAWAREAGHALVIWPADGRPEGARTTGDSAFALAAGDRAVVAPFARPAVLDVGAAGPDGRVIARWADARPAAIERRTDAGCLRTVAVAVPQIGDAALGSAFRALLPALLGPCGVARDAAPLSDADVARLTGRGPLLAAAPLRSAAVDDARDPLGATLLAAAAALLLLELPLRRRSRDAMATQADDASTDTTPRVAREAA